MRKSYAIIAIFSIILCVAAKDKVEFSGIYGTFNEKYKSFDNAFSQQFKDKNDIWLVLGNRGAMNYYRDRFSKNWIFWDDYSSSDSLGISGDFFNLKNWKEVSRLLPKKVNYIAADFNDLVNYPKRNNLIKASKNILNSKGIFCVEDIYDNRKKQFQHFTDKDFEQLSEDFDIKYSYWDGYISSLPYTSDQSANKRSDIFKGLEMMILRLAAANSEEKKKMLPCITFKLYVRSFFVNNDLIGKLVRDIADSTQLRKLIRIYEEDLEKEKQINELIDKEKKEIESLKKDIDNFSRMIKLSGGVKKGLESISKNIESVYRKYLTSDLRKDSFSIQSKMSKFMNKTNNNSEDLQKQLDEKKNMLVISERNFSILQNRLEVIRSYIKDSVDKILKYNDEIFFRFEGDKYLKSYMSYKKEKLEDIISDSKDSDDEFWSEYDSFWNSVSNTEVLATELEKSWSPDILIQNTIPLEKIKTDAERKISDTSKIVILFIKK